MKDRVLGKRYRLGARLGAGGMGAVYEAEDITTGRLRAVKVMHAHTIERDDLRVRFHAEATITAAIRSPYLVDVIDAGVDDDGTPFLVMDRLEGEDLSHRLRRGKLPAEEALSYLAQTAHALDATHRRGIVHRDLKPANLFREDRGHESARIKVLDFGVAKVISEGSNGHTAAAGTPLYMAPEQFRTGKLSPATDIYALGMIAYTLLVGAPYWEDERDELADVIAFALIAVRGPTEPASVRAIRRGATLPSGFDAWFAQATASDPRDRFTTAGAAVLALSEALVLPLDPALAPTLLDGAATRPSAPPARDDGDPDSANDATKSEASLPIAAEEIAATRPEPTTAAPPRSRSTVAYGDARTELAPAKKRKRRLALVGVFALAALAVGFVLWRGRPLADDATVACPVLEAGGAEEPSGWLGAAAAGTACERVRVLLGGSASRTLIPAELLGYRVEPSLTLPIDPYGAPDARSRSLAEAKKRATAYLDGRVTKLPNGFHVELDLTRANGWSAAHGSGEGPALYVAVRAAMEPLTRALGKVSAMAPDVADFTRGPDVDSALALLDLGLSMSQNAGTIAAEHERFAKHADRLAEMGVSEAYRYAYTLGLPAPKQDLPPLPPGTEASIGALASRARARLMMHGDSDPATRNRLEKALEAEESSVGKAMLAATISCLAQASDPTRSRDLALQSVQASPKTVAGEWCAPWIQLVTVTQGTPSDIATVRALRAWVPWETYAWLYDGGDVDPLTRARRANALSPLDVTVADSLAELLISRGAREDARALAAQVAGGGRPIHQLASEIMRTRINASEARFAAALSRARGNMRVVAVDAGWMRNQRLDLGFLSLRIARVLGRQHELADELSATFVEADPSPLDGASVDVPLRVAAFCGLSSRAVATRCFARLPTLISSLSLGVLPDDAAFMKGAELYAKGDMPGAAQAFRPLARAPNRYVDVFGDEMIEAFEAIADKEMVLQIEAVQHDTNAELGGASLTLIRRAKRAFQRGDFATAKHLAQKATAAWATADAPIPELDELRHLMESAR
jgi:serine/threonine protein kinase